MEKYKIINFSLDSYEKLIKCILNLNHFNCKQKQMNTQINLHQFLQYHSINSKIRNHNFQKWEKFIINKKLFDLFHNLILILLDYY